MTNDDEIMADLRRIAADVDPVPGPVDADARAALSTRRLDEELAALLIDSALRADLVRGDDDEVRLLTFESPQVTVELQVELVGAGITVTGLVTSANGDVVVESGMERRSARIDPEGWFTVTGLSHGAIRLHLRSNTGTPVTTSWVLL